MPENDIKLEPILHPNMDILFLPLNPPEKSNSNGHFFSSDKSFWEVLYLSGLLEKRVSHCLNGDIEVFRNQTINHEQAVYGITDLVRRIETDSRKVKTKPEEVQRILNILKENQPKILCLMHSKVRKAFENSNIIPQDSNYGKVGRFDNTIIFSVPFPKGTKYTMEKVVGDYQLLKEYLDEIR